MGRKKEGPPRVYGKIVGVQKWFARDRFSRQRRFVPCFLGSNVPRKPPREWFLPMGFSRHFGGVHRSWAVLTRGTPRLAHPQAQN